MNRKTPVFNRKIFPVLKTLSRNELNEFGRFLGTSVFKCDTEVLRLFKFLKKYHPDYDNLILKEEKVIKAVFHAQPSVPDRLLDKKVSALIHLVEKYLLLKKLEKPSQGRSLLLGEIYGERQAGLLFFRLMEKLKKEVKKKPAPNTWDYYTLTKVHYETYFHPTKVKLEKSPAGDQLKQTIESHKDCFVIGTLRLAVETLSRKMAYAEEINVPLLKEVREQAALMRTNNPLVDLYRLILFHSEHRDDASFNEAETLFRKYHIQIPKADQYIIITMLINFSLILYANQRPSYRLKAFKLYQLAFEESWLEKNRMITADHFTRAVFMGVDLGFWTWVEQLCENSASKLWPEDKDNTLQISNAYLSFAYEKFETVLDLLSKASFPNIFFDLNSRSLIVKSYYELNLRGEDYPIVDYCESYRHYLLRNKNLNSIFLERNLNFLKIVKRMVNAVNEDKEDLQRELLYKVENTPIISKTWLLEKINQLN